LPARRAQVCGGATAAAAMSFAQCAPLPARVLSSCSGGGGVSGGPADVGVVRIDVGEIAMRACLSCERHDRQSPVCVRGTLSPIAKSTSRRALKHRKAAPRAGRRACAGRGRTARRAERPRAREAARRRRPAAGARLPARANANALFCACIANQNKRGRTQRTCRGVSQGREEQRPGGEATARQHHSLCV
jgi:hypothetical protein